MRILLYANSLSGGGAERVMSILSNGLSARGHNILLVTDYCLENEYTVSNSVERVVLVGEYGERGKPLRRNIACVMKLRKLCRQQKSDIIISFMPNNFYRALLAVIGLHTKNLASVRNVPEHLFKAKRTRVFAKIAYMLADGCVFQTQEQMDWFPESMQKKSCIIQNPVSEIFYRTQRGESESRDLVAAGRLEIQKNFALMIRAFARIADLYPEENLVIYGEGILRNELEKLVQDVGLSERVKFLGYVADIAEKIKNARLFVLSSDWEGLPNALMESMALGLPVISTDFSGGGARVLIENGENGLLVPAGDEQALANAMLKLLSNQVLSESIGRVAQESAKAYKTDVIVSRWEVYMQEIGRRK